jgi:2-hydroxycyclohexanecarboxyl-CoA dehydrogenase
VTGGNSNISRGIALAFAPEEVNMVIVGRDGEHGRRVHGQVLERDAKDALWHATDVTDREQVDAMVETVHEQFGSIDALVNDVGGHVDMDDFVDCDPATWQQDIALNIISTLNCAHAVLPGMVERSRGRIINLGSTAGLIGDIKLAVYSAMKGAVHAFTRMLAKEVGRKGIIVNAIAPYGTMPDDPEHDVSSGSRYHPDGLRARLVDTRMEELMAIARSIVMECQFAFPREIGAASVYLASDAPALVTGQVLSVDGGTQLA